MKKYLVYISVLVAIVATGCTDFAEETQLKLPAAPEAVISSVKAEADGDSITFTVAPAAAAGYYAWLVVKSENVDSTLQADRVLKQLQTGVGKGLINYEDQQSAVIGLGSLVPFTVYQIYAVVATPDGVVSKVENVSIRTLDDGGKPTPQDISIEETTVTLNFHEPIRLGDGKVYVSYFAKNTLSGHKPLVVKPGFESFNPQDIEVIADSLSVDGKSLVINLPKAPAGAYASITYEAGAVKDLEGNLSNAYLSKADTLIAGVPSRRITVHVPNKSWELTSEFEESPDTLAAFTAWEDFVISAVPAEGITVAKSVKSTTPVVIYNQIGKTTTVDVTTWGLAATGPVFYLPEEPARGAIIDLEIPEGAYEDVYGNTNEEVAIEGYYIYSYGYTSADVIGTWDLNGINASTGAAVAPETVLIVADTESTDPNAVLIKNLAKNISGRESVVEAVLDPVLGTLTVEDWQLLAEDWTHPAAGTADIFFSTYDLEAVSFSVTASGKITSSNDIWGYYFAKGANSIGALRWYDTSSTWTRTSTSVAAPAKVKGATESAVPLLKASKKIR